MNIVLKGRIIPTQNTVGNVLAVPKSVDGNINSQKQIGGIVSTQTQRLSGIIKNPSHLHGIISKPSGHAQSDHQFVIVDLVKLQAQMLAISNVTAIVPFTAEATQTVSTQFSIHAVPTAVIVNQEPASNVALTATNITVNEEVYTNANA